MRGAICVCWRTVNSGKDMEKPAPLFLSGNVVRAHIHFAVSRQHLQMAILHIITFRSRERTAAQRGEDLAIAMATATAMAIIINTIM